MANVTLLKRLARPRSRHQAMRCLGASLQSKILRGLELRREAQGRRHMHKADELLRTAEKHLKEARPEIIRITRAGDFRRGSELAGDLSLVAEVPKTPDGRKAITAGGELTAPRSENLNRGSTNSGSSPTRNQTSPASEAGVPSALLFSVRGGEGR